MHSIGGGSRGRRPSDGRTSGFTLFEAILVLVILTIVFAMAAAAAHPRLLGVLHAESEARRLAQDMIQARRLTIATGDNHLLLYQIAQGRAVGYDVRRRFPDGTLQPITQYYEFPERMQVTVSHAAMEFEVEGNALAAYGVAMVGSTRRWDLAVAQATGSVRVVAN